MKKQSKPEKRKGKQHLSLLTSIFITLVCLAAIVLADVSSNLNTQVSRTNITLNSAGTEMHLNLSALDPFNQVLGWWEFDVNDSSYKYYDQSERSVTLQPINASNPPNFQASILGSGVTFNGAGNNQSGFLTVQNGLGNFTDLSGGTGFTFGACFTPRAGGSTNRHVVAKYLTASTDGYLLRTQNGDTLTPICLFNPGTGPANIALADINLTAGQYYCVMCTSNGSVFQGIVNGIVSNISTVKTGFPSPVGNPLAVGGDVNLGNIFNGTIDRVFIYRNFTNASDAMTMWNNLSKVYRAQGIATYNYNLTANYINVTLNGCQKILGTNITLQVNNLASVAFSAAGCNVTNYNVTGTPTNANFTLGLQSNASQFYTPFVLNNFTIQGVGAFDTVTVQYPTNFTYYQRDSGNRSNMTIIGQYQGTTPTAILANWNNQGWQVINATPSGGTYKGVYLNALIGQGNLTVTEANQNTTNFTVTTVSVGDIYVVAGASNAVGVGTSNHTYDRTMGYIPSCYWTTSGTWRAGDDPCDDPLSEAPFPGGGTWSVYFFNYGIRRSNVPIANIIVAKGGTTGADWFGPGATEYNAMMGNISVATNGTMKIKHLLFHSGGNDIAANVPYQTFYNRELSMALNFSLMTTNSSKTLIVIKESRPAGSNRTAIDDTRRAQIDLIKYRSDIILPGPHISDLPIGPDNLHLISNYSQNETARRLWGYLCAAEYGCSDSRGPINLTAMWDSSTSNQSFYVNFTDTSLPMRANNATLGASVSLRGWYIQDLGNPGLELTDANITNASFASTSSIRITMAVNTTRNITVSFGSGNDLLNMNMSVDSSQFLLATEPWYYLSVNDLPSQSSSVNACTAYYRTGFSLIQLFLVISIFAYGYFLFYRNGEFQNPGVEGIVLYFVAIAIGIGMLLATGQNYGAIC